uniref:Amino acid transporter n=1 Tax=Timema monikensis TaxID=170555 RepID=A0A7R9E308_9NEOP|nr:unnamed protein product [Timema monikensis]
MKQNLLLVLTIASVLVGVAVGFLGRLARLSDGSIMLVSFPGEILMRLLKMFILPLIISSLVSGTITLPIPSSSYVTPLRTDCKGMAQLDARCSGRMGMRALIYYITTTVLAAIVGILMVLMIHPGDPRIKTQVEGASTRQDVSTLDAILDIVRNLFPDNLMQACFQQVQTTYKKVPQALVFHGPNNSGVTTPDFIMKRSLVYKDGTNVMGELNDQTRYLNSNEVAYAVMVHALTLAAVKLDLKHMTATVRKNVALATMLPTCLRQCVCTSNKTHRSHLIPNVTATTIALVCGVL